MQYMLLQCGLIAFAGPDARTFLHNLLSCDVANLQEDRSTYGSFCTPKGRVLATFLLWHRSDTFFMQLPLPLRPSIQKRLSMYVLRSKVKVSDATDEYRVLSIAGEDAAECVARAIGDAPSAAHGVRHSDQETILKLPIDRYEIVVPVAVSDKMRSALEKNGKEGTREYWNWLAIRAGIPIVRPETQEQFVPQALNLDAIGGVSFAKGCYPGQEIVARMHYLGRLKERMYLVHSAASDAPQPGDKLFGVDMGEQAAGMIVDAAPAAAGGYDALAVIRSSSVAAGPLRLKSSAGEILEMQALPYAFPDEQA